MEPFPAATDENLPKIPFPHVTRFVRQLSHDVRNGLNAADLEAVYIAELATDPELADEAKKLRGIISNVAKMLQGLGGYFTVPSFHLVEFPAKLLIEDFHQRLGKAFPEGFGDVAWSAEVDGEMVEVDLESLHGVLFEIFRNAFQFREEGGALGFAASAGRGKLRLDIWETKAAAPEGMDQWGAEPFISTRRGGFGLGLFSAERNAKAQGGEISRSYDEAAKRLKTRVEIPLKS